MKWIYTDLLGRIQYKDIQNIKIDEVIKAFLLNISKEMSLQNGEFTNDDLLKFFEDNSLKSQNLDSNNNNQKICFALLRDKRTFMNITDLSEIKTKYPNGVDALQLFKIPTRSFQDYFYYHDIKL